MLCKSPCNDTPSHPQFNCIVTFDEADTAMHYNFFQATCKRIQEHAFLIAEIPNALFLFRIECHVVFVLKYTVLLFLPIIFSHSLSVVSSLSVSPSLGKPNLSLLPSFSHSLFHSMHAHSYSLSLTHPQTHKHEFIIVLLSTLWKKKSYSPEPSVVLISQPAL
jgi:hypothetical protein